MVDDHANAAGVLWMIACRSQKQSHASCWSLGVSSDYTLSKQHLVECALMYRHYLQATLGSQYNQLDETCKKKKVRVLLCNFLQAVHASDTSGVNECTVQWQACGRAFKHAIEAQFAVASYLVTLPLPENNVVTLDSLEFPAVDALANNIDSVASWLNCLVAHFYNMLNKQQQSVAQHITNIVNSVTLKRKLDSQRQQQQALVKQQEILTVQMAKTQQEIYMSASPYTKAPDSPHKERAMGVLAKQERLFEDMPFTCELESESPLKMRRLLTMQADSHLKEKMGAKYNSDALYSICANPAPQLNNIDALKFIEASISKHNSNPDMLVADEDASSASASACTAVTLNSKFEKLFTAKNKN